MYMYKRYSQIASQVVSTAPKKCPGGHLSFLKRVRTGSIEQDKTGVRNRKTKKSGPQLDLCYRPSGRKNSFSLERVLQAWCALRSLLSTFAHSLGVGHNFPLSTFAAAEWLYVRDNTDKLHLLCSLNSLTGPCVMQGKRIIITASITPLTLQEKGLFWAIGRMSWTGPSNMVELFHGSSFSYVFDIFLGTTIRPSTLTLVSICSLKVDMPIMFHF